MCRSFLPQLVLVGVSTLPMTSNSRATEPQQLLPAQQVLFDFDTTSDAQKWSSVNDNVMGGRSDGTFRLAPEGTLEFYGNLSLENRGGFASVRSKPAKMAVTDFDALNIRVRGDGRPYYCYLRVSDDRSSYSYRAKFDTEAGSWQEIRLPLRRFQATWRGRTLKDAPVLDAKEIRSVGFLIADKKAGPFKLEVDWVGASNDAATAP